MSQNSWNHRIRAKSDFLVTQVISEWMDKFLAEVKEHFEAEGLEARVIQHEIDHLDGTLILDRISREARKETMRSLREALSGERP